MSDSRITTQPPAPSRAAIGMIIENREKLVPLSRVPKILAANCEDERLAPSVATVRRWVTKGRRGVFLEIISMGQRQFTSRQAVARFISAITEKQLLGRSRRPPAPAGVNAQAIEVAVRYILTCHGSREPVNSVTANCGHGSAADDESRVT